MGLNGTSLLTASTVKSNGGHNHLEGGSGMDLYFAVLSDQLEKQKKGDKIIGL